MTLEDLFHLANLTDAINLLPRPPSLVGSSGLFEEKGVNTTSVIVESKNGQLSLVPAISRNDDPTPVKRSNRSRRTFEVPHLPTSGQVQPSELQGLAGFGQETAVESQATVINDRLQEIEQLKAQTQSSADDKQALLARLREEAQAIVSTLATLH